MEFTTYLGLHFQATRLSRGTGEGRDATTLRALHPLWAMRQHSINTSGRASSPTIPPIRGIPRRPVTHLVGRACRLRAGLLPFQSPLLGESLLVSFPPLIDMLKFCGYSPLKQGRLRHAGGSVLTEQSTLVGAPPSSNSNSNGRRSCCLLLLPERHLLAPVRITRCPSDHAIEAPYRRAIRMHNKLSAKVEY